MKAGVAAVLPEARPSGIEVRPKAPVEPAAAPAATSAATVQPAAFVRTITAKGIGKWVGVGFLAGALTTAAIAGLARMSHSAQAAERPSPHEHAAPTLRAPGRR
jgi:hypothetical protein